MTSFSNGRTTRSGSEAARISWISIAAIRKAWGIEVLRVVAKGSTVVSEVRVPHPTVGPYYALSFFEVDERRITSAREYWVAEAHQEPPTERARWFERM